MGGAPEGLAERFAASFGRAPDFFVRAPGRVDVIGAHVDYNDGPVLVVAIDREVWLAVGVATGGVTTVVAGDLGETARFSPAGLAARRDPDGRPLPVWARYAAGVMWALGQEGLAAPAIDVRLESRVPMGAGLSSSAALEVAFALAWRHAGRWSLAPMHLARLCRRAENEYVGVACGLMDQFASVFGRRGQALLLDCRSLEWQAVPLPEAVTLVVADTTTRRQLSDGRLNERQAECQAALSALQARMPGIAALRDVPEADLERLAHLLPPVPLARARHVTSEIARVQRTAEALAAGRAAAAGAEMNASHQSARDRYDVSGPALEAMWAAARVHPACLGGRAVGAGFAGCMVFLVAADGAAAFGAETATRFEAATGLQARMTAVQAAPGASVETFGRA